MRMISECILMWCNAEWAIGDLNHWPTEGAAHETQTVVYLFIGYKI